MPDLNWLTSPSGAEFLHRLACKGPADCNTIALEFGTHRNNVRKIMHQAHAAGVVHVARFERVHPLDRTASKIWGIGPGVDAEQTLYGREKRHMGRWETAESAARILERLTCGDCDIKTLAAECHLSDPAVRGQLRQMVQAGVVHLCAYRRSEGFGGMHSKIYRLGPGRQAVMPRRKTKSENYRAWRLRKIERFGRETANLMFLSRASGGPDTVVRDGRVVYRRAALPIGVKA